MKRSIARTRAQSLAAAAVAIALACATTEPNLEAGTTALCCCSDGYPAQYLTSSSRRVPLLQAPWEGFGFYLRFPSPSPRTVVITHYLPGVPQELGEGWRQLGYEPADAVDGIADAPVEVRGGRWFTFGTGTGDPTGTYRYAITIDGEPWRTIEFEVAPGGAPVNEVGDVPACPESLTIERP